MGVISCYIKPIIIVIITVRVGDASYPEEGLALLGLQGVRC